MSEAAQARGKTVGEAAGGFSEAGWCAKVRWKSYRDAHEGRHGERCSVSSEVVLQPTAV